MHNRSEIQRLSFYSPNPHWLSHHTNSCGNVITSENSSERFCQLSFLIERPECRKKTSPESCRAASWLQGFGVSGFRSFGLIPDSSWISNVLTRIVSSSWSESSNLRWMMFLGSQYFSGARASELCGSSSAYEYVKNICICLLFLTVRFIGHNYTVHNH